MKTHAAQSSRGSLLIVAMILSAVIGISLVSYMNLGRTSMKISNRALYNNAAMNLAENGLEQAVFAVNKSVTSTFSWTSSPWNTHNTDHARAIWSNYTFDQGATGTVRTYVYNYGTAPKIVTRSSVQLAGSGEQAIEKWIEVQLRKTSKFANGLVAKESISFSGNNASVDSWNSDPDNDGLGIIPYSSAVRNDNGTVGSISVSVNAILVQNADIWGYASTGGALPQVGSNGLVGPFGTSSGTMNPNHVSTDFTASFDPVTAPSGGSALGAVTTPGTIGTAGATSSYTVASISGGGNSSNVLTINGNVTITVVGTGGISFTGQSSIVITSGSSLKIYSAGAIDIGGNGVMNGGNTAATAGRPIDFQIYGTHTDTTTSQSIAIKGNGVLSGVVYAPNANVSIVGNGDVCGSVVAKNISLTGNAAFHYDESLANMSAGNPYRVASWKELTTASQRALYSSVLGFTTP